MWHNSREYRALLQVNQPANPNKRQPIRTAPAHIVPGLLPGAAVHDVVVVSIVFLANLVVEHVQALAKWLWDAQRAVDALLRLAAVVG